MIDPNGMDPYSLQVQETSRKVTPVAEAPGQPTREIAAILQQSRRIRIRQQTRRLKRPAAVIAIILLAAVGWSLLRVQLPRLWSLLNLASASDQTPNVKLTPPLICTGVGADGAPMGVSDSFSEAQVKDTGIGVFLTFSGAVPQKTTFQVKWSIEDRTFESKVLTFDHKADVLYLNLGKDLPVGIHKIEFLVDGVVQQSTSVVIEGAPSQVPPRLSARQPSKRPASSQKGAAPPAEHTAIVPSPIPIAPAPIAPAPPVQTENSDNGAKVTKQAEKVAVYSATHWHGIGSCLGELKLSPGSIEFVSEQHILKFDIKDVRLDRDGIQDPSGKSWHFFIAGTDVERLLGRWKRGELFPSALNEPVWAAAQHTESLPGKVAPGALSSMRTYDARHKHSLGSCSGELKLTPETIEFASQEHYFKYHVNEVQIDRDGILDRSGKTWRFDILGENVGEMLRLWKAGKLFSQNETGRNCPDA